MNKLFTPDSCRTVTGNYVNFKNPEPDTFNIEDIANSLAKVPRFGGHLDIDCDYSVLDHCLLVASLVPDHLKLEALLHDATEAYMGDAVSPLKQLLPDYRKVEERMHEAIAIQFQIPVELSPEVKAADRTALTLEWAMLVEKTIPVHFTERTRSAKKHEFMEMYCQYSSNEIASEKDGVAKG